MLPMRLFRGRAFAGINAASMLMFTGMFGSIFLLSQFLQNVVGYSPTEAGLRMLPWTGMPMIVAPIAGYLSDRIGGRPVVTAGLALQALGLGWFATILSPDVSYAAQLPALVISGTGMALFIAPAANLVLSSVRTSEHGIASGANNALREVGGALGIAVLGSIFSANGGYGAPTEFVAGLTPALWVGAGILVAAVGAALVIPRRRAGEIESGPVPAGTVSAARRPAEPAREVPASRG
jgi:predicted MFS family arabinose efflux permease